MIVTLHALLLFYGSFFALEWSTQELNIDVGKDVVNYSDSFVFKNTTTEEIKILEIKASCGCTALELKKKIYKPGESGELKFNMNFRENSKFASSIIIVKTNTEEYTLKILLKRDISENDSFKAVPAQKIDVVKLLKNLKSNNNKLTEKIFQKSQSYKPQKNCPYLRTPILEKYYHDTLGLRIFTCCAGCLEKVKANPHDAIARLAAVGQFPIVIEQSNKE